MQNKAAKKIKDRPATHRPHADGKRFRARSNGRSKGAADADLQRIFGLSVLASDLRTYSGLEMALKSGDKHFYDLIKTIDTEEKQLQAISDLYEIVKAQPKYKKMKEPNWKETDRPIDILLWLLRKLGPLAAGESWTIDTWQQGRKDRYRFVVYKHFSGMDYKSGLQFMPLDFLPFLKKKDQALHNMILDAVALMSKHNRIPLWDEDGDFSEVLNEWLNETGIVNNYLMEQQIHSYRCGVAYTYLNLIKKRMKMVRPSDLWQAINLYDDNSDRKRRMKFWLRSAYHLIKSKADLRGFDFVPNHLRFQSYVNAQQHYKFIWSEHELDILHAKTVPRMENAEHQFPPLNFSITYPGKEHKPLGTDDFPIDLSRFMHWGQRLVTGSYKQYYYKSMLDDPNMTPSEYYVNSLHKAIEQNEITEIRKNEQRANKRTTGTKAGHRRASQ